MMDIACISNNSMMCVRVEVFRFGYMDKSGESIRVTCSGYMAQVGMWCDVEWGRTELLLGRLSD